jgi:hypothetical protein
MNATKETKRIVVTSLRIPEDIWQNVMAVGQANHRSAHAQALVYIEDGLQQEIGIPAPVHPEPGPTPAELAYEARLEELHPSSTAVRPGVRTVTLSGPAPEHLAIALYAALAAAPEDGITTGQCRATGAASASRARSRRCGHPGAYRSARLAGTSTCQ